MSSTESHPSGMTEDWGLLLSFLPCNWRDLAASTGALKGLRKDKSADNLLRVLLIHLGGGHSLHETAVRARQANLAELSAVALWNRLKKSQAWLRALCVELFRERGLELSASAGLQVRAINATTVKEPGKTGSLWRMHYSVCLPSLACDFFKLTETQGAGTGESFVHFPIRAGDYLLADRGYSTVAGIRYVADAGGRVTVRVNTRALPLRTLEFAKYVIVFTTFPAAEFTNADVLEWYRTRWQVELVFKRFKSLAQLGHLPKRDDESAKAWLYGKLFVALLVEKLISHARTISPWGYRWAAETATQRVA